MSYVPDQKIIIPGPPPGIVYCIFVAIAGLVLPLVLFPVVKMFGYSEVVEEIAKALVVLVIISKIPGLKSKILATVLFGFMFGFSENILYLNQLVQGGVSNVFIQRFFITVPMHIVTVLVVLGCVRQRRFLLPVGIAIAVAVHLGFNFLVQ